VHKKCYEKYKPYNLDIALPHGFFHAGCGVDILLLLESDSLGEFMVTKMYQREVKETSRPSTWPGFIIMLVCCFLSSSPLQAAINFVQTVGQTSAASSSTTTVVNVASSVTSGNTVIVTIAMNYGAGGALSCSDSSGNSYTVDLDVNDTFLRSVTCAAHNVTALTTSDTITVSHPSVAARAVSAHEFSGLTAVSTLDRTSFAGGVFDRFPDSGNTATTSQADELLIGNISVEGPVSDGFTLGTGYTALARAGTSTAPTDVTVNPEYQIVSSTGIYSSDGTLSTDRWWIALVSTYRAATINISGTCKQANQTSDCFDTGTIRVAINGTLRAQTQTMVSGSWTISGVVAPEIGDVITVFVDGATDTREAVAVTKYDGSGNITGLELIEQHLTIGSNDNQTITNADLSQYDNSASGDEDLFHEVNGTNDLTVDVTGLLSAEEVYIKGGNIFRPDSTGSGNVTTHDLEINGTLIADNNSITLNGSWDNNATFTAGSSSVNFTAGSGTELIDSTGATTADFYNITFNDSAGAATFQLESALDVANDLTVSDGILNTKSGSSFAINAARHMNQTGGQIQANNSTLTVSGDFLTDGSEDSSQFNNASVVLTGTGILSYNNLSPSWANGFNNLTVGQGGNTTTANNAIGSKSIRVNTTLTVGSGTLTGGNSFYLMDSNPLSFDANATVSINWLQFLSGGTQTLPPLANGYDCNIVLAGSNSSLLVNQTGNVTLNAGHHLHIIGDGFAHRTSTYATNGFDLTVGGDIIIGAGNDTGLKTLDGTNSTITVGGDFEIRDIGTGSQQATFTSANSTVTLNGTAAQTVLSSGASFNDLVVTNASGAGVSFLDALNTTNFTDTTAGSSLTFQSGVSHSISGAFTLSGASGNEIILRSDSGGSQWGINITGTKAVDYVDVQDSDASGSSAGNKPIEPANSLDSGNNTDWFSDCTVVNTNDAGNNSLRDCITYANGNPGATIKFNIPNTDANYQTSGGDSWWRIRPTTALPAISAAGTVIDGATQTSSQGDSNSLGPEIEIDGTTAGAGGWDGLETASSVIGVTIKGLIINNWSRAGISLNSGTGSNVVTGNYIGTNYAATVAQANTSYGVYVSADGNTIGGTTATDRNVISGNVGPGIHIAGDSNTIQGNYIGVNATASGVLANTTNGIQIRASASGNIIGGTVAGAGNVISGNVGDGIRNTSSGTSSVQGNYIGTNASSASHPNGGDGFYSDDGTVNLGHASEAQSNVIGPNTDVGINLAGGTINLAGTIDVNDDVTLTTGTFVMGSASLNVAGNWVRSSATVTPGTSTVTLNGTNQTISGSTTFYNLSKTETVARTLTFAANSTQTIASGGTVTLTGDSGQLLALNCSGCTPMVDHWNLNISSGAFKSIDYVDVSDADADGSDASHKPINPTNYNDGGNTISWFGSAVITVMKLSAVISDPINGATNPKRIPGSIIEYTVVPSNSGAASPDANTVIVTDAVDAANVSFDTTTGVSFTDGTTSSGLAIGTVTYSNTPAPGPYVYSYIPGAGYDGNVTSIQITTTGTFNFGGSPDPSFTLRYRVRVD